jgi:hypothetical protein
VNVKFVTEVLGVTGITLRTYTYICVNVTFFKALPGQATFVRTHCAFVPPIFRTLTPLSLVLRPIPVSHTTPHQDTPVICPGRLMESLFTLIGTVYHFHAPAFTSHSPPNPLQGQLYFRCFKKHGNIAVMGFVFWVRGARMCPSPSWRCKCRVLRRATFCAFRC